MEAIVGIIGLMGLGIWSLVWLENMSPSVKQNLSVRPPHKHANAPLLLCIQAVFGGSNDRTSGRSLNLSFLLHETGRVSLTLEEWCQKIFMGP